MAETRPGNHERGWNDPPVFLHNVTAENQTPKKNLLTKRVAYSPGGPGNASQPPGLKSGPYSTGTPPPARPPVLSTGPTAGCPSTPPALSQQQISKPPQSLHNDYSIINDVEILEEVLAKLEAIKVLLKPRVQEDVKKKLLIFEESWKGGKMSQNVKSKMQTLARALGDRDCDTAHTIHLSLMMDYTNEVGQWMVGIKKLIYEARSLPLSTTKGTNQTKACSVETNMTASDLGSETILPNSDMASNQENRTEPNILDFEKLTCDTTDTSDSIAVQEGKTSMNNDLPECDQSPGDVSTVEYSSIERS